MKEWFEQAFGADYAHVYAHRDSQEAQLAIRQILSHLTLRPGDRVLDAPCGFGRHARILAQHYHTTGLDLSSHLLGLAIKIDTAANSDPTKVPHYVQGDLRELPFGAARFQLVVNLFTSIGYFATEEENCHAIRELARVCMPGGWVVIDYLNAQQVIEGERERTLDDNRTAHESVRIVGLPPRIEKRVVISGSEGDQSYRESVRLYSEEDLDSILESCHLQPIHKFGDYRESPFDSQTSSRLFIIALKK